MTWLLTRGRFLLLITLAGVTAWLGVHAARVDVERDNASLTTSDPQRTETYRRFRQIFGSDEDMLLAIHDPALLEPAGLRRVVELTDAVAALDGVRRVFSLSNAKQLVHGDIGAVDAPLLPPLDAPDAGARVAAALDRNPDFTGWLISADRTTAGIVIESEERENDHEYRSRLIHQIRDLGTRAVSDSDASYHLTGITVQKHDVGDYVDRDRRVLMPAAVVVIAVLLATFFRSLLGVALPLAVTGMSVVWTLGILELAGLKLNAITALLPPVIMVLSVAVSVHLLQAWLQSRETAPLTRILEVVRSIGFASLFCSITTSLGLLSLLVAELTAVRQFGLFAAIGVCLSFVIGITFVPVGLTFAAPPARPQQSRQHRWLRAALDWSARVTIERPGLVLTVFAVVTAVSLAGLPLLRNNTDLVRFLRSDAPLYVDTMFIDEHLTGAVAIELMITRRDGEPMVAHADVARLAELDRAARQREHVAATTSILPVLRQLQRAESGSDVLALPSDERETRYLFDLIEAAEDQSLISKLVSADFRVMRMSVRLHAVGTSIAAPLAEELTADARRIFGEEYVVEPTGAFYGVARDSNSLVRDQIASFGLGTLTVYIAMALLLRSLTLTTVSLIPNLTPIFWTGGLMGFAGIDLSSGTAMIASAVIGLVVDDTIHYLHRYREEYRGDAAAAVRATTASVGESLALNNFVLIVGFWVGCLGSFKPTIYFSLLTGMTMMTAMLCDVFITPALLILTDRRQTLKRGQVPLLPLLVATCALVVATPVARAAEDTPGAAAAGEVVIPPALQPLLEAAGEQVLARIAVPDEARQVGDVRLVRRNGADAVETILHTKLMRRVVAEIRQKETPNWPAGAPGHEDSLRYLAALEAAQQDLWARVPRLDRNADQQQKLLIEFVLSPSAAVVVLSEPTLTGDDETLKITARRPMAVLDLSRAYIARNMRLIAADSFKKEGPALETMLAGLPVLSGEQK